MYSGVILKNSANSVPSYDHTGLPTNGGTSRDDYTEFLKLFVLIHGSFIAKSFSISLKDFIKGKLLIDRTLGRVKSHPLWVTLYIED